MVLALEYLTESAFADQLNKLEAVSDLVTGHDAIVALIIVEAVVDEALKLGRLVLLFFLSNVVDLLILGNFCLLVNR